jgi:ribonuclease Z
MSELVQVAVAGSVDEAEELQALLTRAGIVAALEGGRVVRPDEVVGLARLGRSVVLTGDTAPAKSVVEAADGADVLVHEATFLADERARARETEHSTAAEAALVAREAGVGLLALTHLSARYSVSEVAEEARALFPQTVVPRDFDLLEVPLPERGAPKLVARGGRRGPREDVGSAA